MRCENQQCLLTDAWHSLALRVSQWIALLVSTTEWNTSWLLMSPRQVLRYACSATPSAFSVHVPLLREGLVSLVTFHGMTSVESLMKSCHLVGPLSERHGDAASMSRIFTLLNEDQGWFHKHAVRKNCPVSLASHTMTTVWQFSPWRICTRYSPLFMNHERSLWPYCIPPLDLILSIFHPFHTSVSNFFNNHSESPYHVTFLINALRPS
jgi:hypothetical protein